MNAEHVCSSAQPSPLWERMELLERREKGWVREDSEELTQHRGNNSTALGEKDFPSTNNKEMVSNLCSVRGTPPWLAM